jgi:hypothetical protein
MAGTTVDGPILVWKGYEQQKPYRETFNRYVVSRTLGGIRRIAVIMNA